MACSLLSYIAQYRCHMQHDEVRFAGLIQLRLLIYNCEKNLHLTYYFLREFIGPLLPKLVLTVVDDVPIIHSYDLFLPF